MERQRTLPFLWGERDCVLYAATLADAISDGEYVKRARSAFAWTNVKQAAALLGDGTLQALVEVVMGPMVRWTRLNMGDIALVFDENNRQSLATHDGTQVIGAVDPGIQVIPFRYVQGGWHVT